MHEHSHDHQVDHHHDHEHDHHHDHDHDHQHPQAEHHERHDMLVLDIGGDIGALMITTGPSLDEAEIEISPGTDPAAKRTHNQVHVRRYGNQVAYTAVYPTVEAGDYTVWHLDGTPYAQVTVRGGEVSLLNAWA